MYGVKDANGVELENGDNVRILAEPWPEPEYQQRVGTLGKVEVFEDDELVLVTFEDGDSNYYATDNVALEQKTP